MDSISMCTPMFTAGCSQCPQGTNSPESTADEWHGHVVEYYITIKRNEVLVINSTASENLGYCAKVVGCRMS
jgi:hypothetical protein